MKVHIGKYPKNPNKERKVKIEIEKFDLWDFKCVNMIILEWLKKFREMKQSGHPCDIPLFSQTHEHHTDQMAFDFYIDSNPSYEQCMEEWKSIIDKMIWSFNEIITEENGDCYWIVKPEIDWDGTKENVVDEAGSVEVLWKVEGVIDELKRSQYHARIDEGLDLFRKYIRNLWD
jgi:hypothetical protein